MGWTNYVPGTDTLLGPVVFRQLEGEYIHVVSERLNAGW